MRSAGLSAMGMDDLGEPVAHLALADGVLRALGLNKLRTPAAVVLILALGVGAGALAYRAWASPQPDREAPAGGRGGAADVRADAHGDPLPDDAPDGTDRGAKPTSDKRASAYKKLPGVGFDKDGHPLAEKTDDRVFGAKAGKVRVHVSDNGVGPAEKHPEIQPFKTTTDLRYAGMGIGLTLARQILQAHECDISLERGPRGGARVQFDLPSAKR